jgi:hypothetical protein
MEVAVSESKLVSEAFEAGARWARMAAERAFDDALLAEDAKHYDLTGEIRCRGDGTLRHANRVIQRTLTDGIRTKDGAA